MDILQLGTKLLQQYLGNQGNPDAISGALGQLLGGSGGKIDLGSLVAQLSSNKDLQGLVSSWLADGPNKGIDPAQILALFGQGKVGSFAQQIGVSTDTAAGGLAATLPQLVDKFSSGGNLLESVGGVEGVLGLAKKFF
jgi:uncharacterized protein YidB (DUF937 family)